MDMVERPGRRDRDVAQRLREVSRLYEQKRADLYENLQKEYLLKECTFQPKLHRAAGRRPDAAATQGSLEEQKEISQGRLGSRSRLPRADTAALSGSRVAGQTPPPDVYERLFKQAERRRESQERRMLEARAAREEIDFKIFRDYQKAHRRRSRSADSARSSHANADGTSAAREPLYKPAYLAERFEQRHLKKEELATEGCTFAPAISQKSKVLAARKQQRSPTTVHERLYRQQRRASPQGSPRRASPRPRTLSHDFDAEMVPEIQVTLDIGALISPLPNEEIESADLQIDLSSDLGSDAGETSATPYSSMPSPPPLAARDLEDQAPLESRSPHSVGIVESPVPPPPPAPRGDGLEHGPRSEVPEDLDVDLAEPDARGDDVPASESLNSLTPLPLPPTRSQSAPAPASDSVSKVPIDFGDGGGDDDEDDDDKEGDVDNGDIQETAAAAAAAGLASDMMYDNESPRRRRPPSPRLESLHETQLAAEALLEMTSEAEAGPHADWLAPGLPQQNSELGAPGGQQGVDDGAKEEAEEDDSFTLAAAPKVYRHHATSQPTSAREPSKPSEPSQQDVNKNAKTKMQTAAPRDRARGDRARRAKPVRTSPLLEDFLRYGAHAEKHGRIGKPHHCRLTGDAFALFWTSKHGQTNRVPWESVVRVSKGRAVAARRSASVYSRQQAKSLLPRRRSASESATTTAQDDEPADAEFFFFTVATTSRDIIFSVKTRQQRDRILEALQLALRVAGSTAEARARAEREALLPSSASWRPQPPSTPRPPPPSTP